MFTATTFKQHSSPVTTQEFRPLDYNNKNGLFPEQNYVPNSRFASPYTSLKQGLYESTSPVLTGLGQGYAHLGSQEIVGPSHASAYESNKGYSSSLPDDRNTKPSTQAQVPSGPLPSFHNQQLNDSHLKFRGFNNNQPNPTDSIRMNKEYMKSMYKNLQSQLNITEENDIPQFALFLLREENDNIANFRERIERDKAKIVHQLDHMRRQMSNLIDDLQTHLHQQIDQHFLSFIDHYKHFKQEIIAYKSISNDLIQVQQKYQEQPHQKMRSLIQPKQFLGKHNSQLIRELDELQQRNEAAKVQTYINQCQSTQIKGLQDISSSLMAILSSPQPFFNFQVSQKLRIIKYLI